MKKEKKTRNESVGEKHVIFSKVIECHNCFAYLGKYSPFSVGQWLRMCGEQIALFIYSNVSTYAIADLHRYFSFAAVIRWK